MNTDMLRFPTSKKPININTYFKMNSTRNTPNVFALKRIQRLESGKSMTSREENTGSMTIENLHTALK